MNNYCDATTAAVESGRDSSRDDMAVLEHRSVVVTVSF